MRNATRLRHAVPLMFGVALSTLMAVPAAGQLNQPLHTDGWIVAAAHAPGLQESIWRTDLWVFRDDTAAEVRLTFCEKDTDNTGAEEHEVVFGEGEMVAHVEDVVDAYLGTGDGSWTGAIHYTSTYPVHVWARVYSVNAERTASYGQMIEGIPAEAMSPDDDPWDYTEHQYLIAAKHTADDRYRVNIGVVNPTSVWAHYWVRAWGVNGQCAPTDCMTFSVDVPPYSMVQKQDPFADWQDGSWDKALILVKCETDGAGGFAYASVVDNATNDAYFIHGMKRKGSGE